MKPTARWLLLTPNVAFFVLVAALVVSALTDRGYDPISGSISDLALHHRAGSNLTRAAFMFEGVSFLPVAWGAYRLQGREALATAIGLVFGLVGLCLIFLGAVPPNVHWHVAWGIRASVLHNSAFIIGILAFIAGLVLEIVLLRRQRRWRYLSTGGICVLVIIVIIAIGGLGNLWTNINGVLERLLVAVCIAWFLAFANTLFFTAWDKKGLP